MALVNVAKFVLGVSLAIAIMIGGGFMVALYFMYKVTTHPPKPIFANEKVTKKAQTPPKENAAPQPQPVARSNQQPTESDNSSPPPLEPGTYKARVTWQQGLSLRSEPSQNAERTGGLDYNQQIIVLEESADRNWQRVRLADGEQEGWVKAGNLERIQTQE